MWDRARARYQAALTPFIDEMGKFYAGGQGTEANREKLEAGLSPDAPPAARRAAMQQLTTLLQGKVTELQRNWHNVMGPGASDYPIIGAPAQAVIAKVNGLGAPAPAAATQPPSAASSSWSAVSHRRQVVHPRPEQAGEMAPNRPVSTQLRRAIKRPPLSPLPFQITAKSRNSSHAHQRNHGNPSVNEEHVRKIRQILALLSVAQSVGDLDVATFRLHPLKGDLKGFWSLTVRANWRIIFRFEDGKAFDVDLVNYH